MLVCKLQWLNEELPMIYPLQRPRQQLRIIVLQSQKLLQEDYLNYYSIYQIYSGGWIDCILWSMTCNVPYYCSICIYIHWLLLISNKALSFWDLTTWLIMNQFCSNWVRDGKSKLTVIYNFPKQCIKYKLAHHYIFLIYKYKSLSGYFYNLNCHSRVNCESGYGQNKM